MNQAHCLQELRDNFGRCMVYVDRLGEIKYFKFDKKNYSSGR